MELQNGDIFDLYGEAYKAFGRINLVEVIKLELRLFPNFGYRISYFAYHFESTSPLYFKGPEVHDPNGPALYDFPYAEPATSMDYRIVSAALGCSMRAFSDLRCR